MVDVRVVELASRQHNRFSRAQVMALGIDDFGIRHRLTSGRWAAIHDAVYGIAPIFDDDLGRWTAAVLSAEGSVLSHASAAAAWGWWQRCRRCEVVTRPGSGGPRHIDGLLVHRSETLEGDVTRRFGIPITTVPRTLLDQAAHVSAKDLARSTREALRLGLTTPVEMVDALAVRHRRRRGNRRLLTVVARYTGLPIERCRSGAEVRALEILRDAGRRLPAVNRPVAGEEADLIWRQERVIIEVDGPQYHLDRGEDARKQAVWEQTGWEVRRIPSPELFDHPERLLALAPIGERP